MTEEQVSTTSDAPSPGTRLARAREAMGLTVADAAAQMRLAPRQVEALEADRYGDLPGPVFVRGFLRNYARLLKLDPGPLLAGIDPADAHVAPLRGQLASGEIPFPTRHHHRWIPYVAVAIAVLLLAAALEYWFAQRSRQGEAAPEVPAIPREVAPPAPTPGDVREPAVSGSAPETAASSPPVQPAGAAPAAEPAAAAQTPAATSWPAKVRLTFSAESWVEIRDPDGNVVHLRTHRAGEMHALEAQRGAAFVIGNAAAVRMTYNDAPFDLGPHSNVGVARFKLE